ncbi:MAG: hypothetical protein ACD_63C00148G0005 [uncultured bacterium]|nr:MAG: hypothetical protein ACD_63C00148G0005 [uncultured bacterium]
METIIGLEIHARLKTKSKMFCTCSNDSEDLPPNTNVCPICMGHPGTLPKANIQAIHWTVLSGLALNCKIPKFSKFDRKSYFYPDLPKGYQISQYDMPICKGGKFSVSVDGSDINVKLRRVHLEEDAGKLVHPEGSKYSLVDYNRAGTPLMEIVTEPDLHSPMQAKVFIQELQKLLRSLGISDADMEKGQLRCDANISVKDGSKSTKPSEVKNMNSFRSIERALAFEEKRHRDLLEDGKYGKKETRGWDDIKQVTVDQRSKEEAHDYRYFPEPDLPPLEFGEAWVDEIRTKLPEMPRETEKRFKKFFKVKDADAKILAGDKYLSTFFENTVSELKAWAESSGEVKPQEVDKRTREFAKLTANWILSELMKHIKKEAIGFDKLKITPENMAEFINIVNMKKINSSAAQTVLAEMFETGKDPSQIVEDRNLEQVSDQGELESAVDEIVATNSGVVEDFKKGKENALQFLVGQVMKKTKGKANPQIVIDILRKKLT